MSKTKKKICIVATSLHHGGAERASAMQSVIFDDLGHEVFIVTIISGVAYNYAGTVFNLGQFKDKNDSVLGRISRLFKFKKFLDKHKFDLIIDNRARNQVYRELIISKFIYNIPTVYVIHSFEESLAFTKYNWLNKWLYRSAAMVAVSKTGALKFKRLYGLNNIKTIYNAFNFQEIIKLSKEKVKNFNEENYIIYYGRIHDKSKNLKLLLDAYKHSKLMNKNLKLLILGDGEDLVLIKQYAKFLGLEHHVIFKSFERNPFPYVKRALFTVLTSKSEGFAMILPESLILKTPVLSVDCDAGPKEIITHNYNGVLVENFSAKSFGDAMNSLVADKILYENCKRNAKQSVEKFSIKNIQIEWEKLISEMTGN